MSHSFQSIAESPQTETVLYTEWFDTLWNPRTVDLMKNVLRAHEYAQILSQTQWGLWPQIFNYGFWKLELCLPMANTSGCLHILWYFKVY